MWTTFSASFGVSCTYAVPPKSPPSTNSINLFLPLDEAPSVIGRLFGDPELPADESVIEIIPLTASSRISKLELANSQAPGAIPPTQTLIF